MAGLAAGDQRRRISAQPPETGDSARVTFVTVNSPPEDAVGTAQTLIANGCENQLDVLVEATPSMD